VYKVCNALCATSQLSIPCAALLCTPPHSMCPAAVLLLAGWLAGTGTDLQGACSSVQRTS
jgi:hypothetical protein